MSRDEGLLARWSRRKRLAAARARDASPTDRPGGDALPPTPAPDAPLGEPEGLPPVESLDAASDIKAFLAPGVPAELTRRALRRAWRLDPAIRDFIGLSENAWDFTAPGGVPGFASMTGEAAQRLLAQATGSPEGAATEPPAVAPEPQERNGERHLPDPNNETAPDAAMHQKSEDNEAGAKPAPRRHGGALPK